MVVTLPSMLPARGCASSRSPPEGFAARGWGSFVFQVSCRHPICHLSIYLSVCLSVCLSVYHTIYRYIYIYMWGYPKWIVYNGKSIYKWMIWGYPYFRKPPYMQSTCDAIPFDSTVPCKAQRTGVRSISYPKRSSQTQVFF